jgi:hypothetical protein
MSKRFFTFVLAASFGFIFTLVGFPKIYAQETKADEYSLEEITVTAQKRAENQQKVPIAMATISGETIKEMGKTTWTTSLIMFRTPSLIRLRMV